jgi:hypothetical protein
MAVDAHAVNRFRPLIGRVLSTPDSRAGRPLVARGGIGGPRRDSNGEKREGRSMRPL